MMLMRKWDSKKAFISLNQAEPKTSSPQIILPISEAQLSLNKMLDDLSKFEDIKAGGCFDCLGCFGCLAVSAALAVKSVFSCIGWSKTQQQHFFSDSFASIEFVFPAFICQQRFVGSGRIRWKERLGLNLVNPSFNLKRRKKESRLRLRRTRTITSVLFWVKREKPVQDLPQPENWSRVDVLHSKATNKVKLDFGR